MKYIFILIFFVLSLQNTYASHVAGGELTYQCMGLDSFKFTYVFYNDCYSPIANNVVGMWIYNLPGFGDQILLSMTSNSPIEIVSNCPGVTTTCHGGTSPGIQKYIYEGYYVFPDTSSHWEFIISESTRSCATTTFQTPCANNLYIHATLNNTNLSCCNSPVFKEDPIIFTCVNQPYCLDLSTTSGSGDSLVYSLIDPLVDPNSTMPYSNGYSLAYPLVLNQPFLINSVGQICFTALQPDITTYVVLVSSYKNGILISEVERDIQLYVTNCNGLLPDLSGINGGTSFDTTVCAYTPFCFEIFSNDLNLSDSTFLSWDQSLSTATFTPTGAKNDSAAFCWTPSSGDIDSIPHCFTVFAKDKSCPAYQVNSKKYCIRVDDLVSGSCTVNMNTISSTENNYIKVYPQPSTTFFDVDFGEQFNKVNCFSIIDFLGKEIFQTPVTDKYLHVNVAGKVSNGIYFAVVREVSGRIIGRSKLVVENY